MSTSFVTVLVTAVIPGFFWGSLRFLSGRVCGIHIFAFCLWRRSVMLGVPLGVLGV